jgi:hypothetical protein
MFTAADVHRFEGIAVYFAGLMLLHELVRWLQRSAALALAERKP